MKTKERLQTTLDRLPYGPEGMPEDQKVSKKLPGGVQVPGTVRGYCPHRRAQLCGAPADTAHVHGRPDDGGLHGRDGESGNGDPGTGGRGIDHPA